MKGWYLWGVVHLREDGWVKILDKISNSSPYDSLVLSGIVEVYSA